MHELRMVYEEIGGDIMHFLKLYKLSKAANMNPEHIINLLQMSNEYLPLSFQVLRSISNTIKCGADSVIYEHAFMKTLT